MTPDTPHTQSGTKLVGMIARCGGVFPLPPLRQPYPPKHQAQRHDVIEMQHLAEDHHAEQRAEDRDQVDEDAGAVGADDLVALDEQHLGDERGEHGGEGCDQPAGGVGPDHGFAGDLECGEGQRGEEGGPRHHRDHRLPVQLRLVAQRHRVAAVADHSEQHQRVALVELEPDQADEAAARGRDRHA